MSTLGIFNTSNFAPTQITPSFASVIHENYPNGSAPLLGITSRIPKQGAPVTSIKHSWYMKNFFLPNCTVSVPVAASAGQGTLAQITVVEADSIIEGMVLMVESTYEQVLVQGVSGNVVTVRRQAGSTPGRAIAAGTKLYSIGTAFEESSLRPLPVGQSYMSADNITQIFRNSWAVSGTAAAVALQVGTSQVATSLRDAGMQHALDIEKSILFGEKYEGTLKGQPLRKMSGIKSFIETYAPQNVMQAPKYLTYDALEEMTAPMFNIVTDNMNSNDRLLFTDNVGMAALSKLGRSMGIREYTGKETAFGMAFTSFVTSHGTFQVMTHPLFNTMPMRGMMMFLDLSSMELKHLQGRDTDYKEFNPNANSANGTAQDNGIDAKGGTYTSEITLEVHAPAANAIIYGVCEIGCAPCVPVTNDNGSISVDKPCPTMVDPNSAVVVTVKGKANTTVKVVTPNSIVDVALNASGTGTLNYTVGTMSNYYFAIVADPASTTIYQPAMASVCVKQGCEPTVQVEQEC